MMIMICTMLSTISAMVALTLSAALLIRDPYQQR
jgi:hypothetical protein